MSAPTVISLSPLGGVKVEGDVLQGVVQCIPSLITEKNVVSVRISLKAEMHTSVLYFCESSNYLLFFRWVRVSNGQSTVVYRGFASLLDMQDTLWDQASLGAQISPENLPFSFRIPDQLRGSLLPSFHCGNSRQGARVQYFIRVEAVRKAWYQRNPKITRLFPFLPLDRTSAPSQQFANWQGAWKTYQCLEEMRNNPLNIFALTAVVELEVRLV